MLMARKLTGNALNLTNPLYITAMKINQLSKLIVAKIKEYWQLVLLLTITLIIAIVSISIRLNYINKQKRIISTLKDRIDDLESKVNDLQNEVYDLEDNQKAMLFP